MVLMMALCSETISMGIPKINGFRGGHSAGVSLSNYTPMCSLRGRSIESATVHFPSLGPSTLRPSDHPLSPWTLKTKPLLSNTCLLEWTNDMIHWTLLLATIWILMDSDENNLHSLNKSSVINWNDFGIERFTRSIIFAKNRLPVISQQVAILLWNDWVSKNQCSCNIFACSESFICWIAWIKLKFFQKFYTAVELLFHFICPHQVMQHP